MAVPRSIQINLQNPGWVHCTARCVRQAFLAGDGFDHRRGWIERRLQFLSGVFACEIGAYAVLSNHVHVIVRMAPEQADAWSDEEVALRWLRAYPGYRDDEDRAEASSVAIEDWMIASRAADAEWIAERRKRLSSLSWFMRSLCEPIARRANLEDDCRGRFWEGRFHSAPLLDEAALLACMVYVDLNPIRAQMATSVEDSFHTSAHARLETTRRDSGLKATETTSLAVVGEPNEGRNKTQSEPAWLASLGRLTARDRDTGLGGLTPLQYLHLVESTGRVVRGDKRGAIANDLPDLLERIDSDFSMSAWILTMCGWRQMSAGSVGRRENLDREAQRRGHQRARTRCALFRRRPLSGYDAIA